jgi:hypothetical protein
MDITKVAPETYAQMLREQGVPEEQITERFAHDMLVALAAQLNALPESERNPLTKDLSNQVNQALMRGAKNEKSH